MAKIYICPTCHTIGKAKSTPRGKGPRLRSWMYFPLNVPFIIMWMTRRAKVCRSCGEERLIDENSPVGLRLMAKFDEGKFSPKPFDTPHTRTLDNSSPIPKSDSPKIHSKDHQF